MGGKGSGINSGLAQKKIPSVKDPSLRIGGKPRQTFDRADKRLPTAKDLITIEALTSCGLGIHAVAEDLGMSHDVLERWRKEFPEVASAVIRGRAKRRRRAYTCFFNQAFPIDDQGRPTNHGDSSLMIFWMKTREKWREVAKDINLHSKNTLPPNLEFVLKKEIADEITEENRVDKSTRKLKK